MVRSAVMVIIRVLRSIHSCYLDAERSNEYLRQDLGVTA